MLEVRGPAYWGLWRPAPGDFNAGQRHRQRRRGGLLPGSHFCDWESIKKFFLIICVFFRHRRRMNTEEKAKVVAAAWGTELIQFLDAQAIFSPGWFEIENEQNNGDMAKWMLWQNGWSSGSHYTKPPHFQNRCSPKKLRSNHPSCGIQVRPPTNSDDLCLLFCLYTSSMASGLEPPGGHL